MEDAGDRTTPELNDKLDSLGRLLMVMLIGLPILALFFDFKPIVTITGTLSYGDLAMVGATIGILIFAGLQYLSQKQQFYKDNRWRDNERIQEIRVTVLECIAIISRGGDVDVKLVNELSRKIMINGRFLPDDLQRNINLVYTNVWAYFMFSPSVKQAEDARKLGVEQEELDAEFGLQIQEHSRAREWISDVALFRGLCADFHKLIEE